MSNTLATEEPCCWLAPAPPLGVSSVSPLLPDAVLATSAGDGEGEDEIRPAQCQALAA